MNILRSFISPIAACAFILFMGAPGLAQSQMYYDDYDNYYDPFYDPYFDDYGNYGYDYGYDEYIQTDPELRAEIMRDLSMSPFVDGEDITVSVDAGIATLSGRVEDRSAMIDAVEIAYDAGAWNVRNELDQRDRDERPWVNMRDHELKEDIREELTYSPFVNSDNIRVTVRNGVATLFGGVENKGEIADAVENAYEAGAKRVKSRLWVDPDLS